MTRMVICERCEARVREDKCHEVIDPDEKQSIWCAVCCATFEDEENNLPTPQCRVANVILEKLDQVIEKMKEAKHGET